MSGITSFSQDQIGRSKEMVSKVADSVGAGIERARSNGRNLAAAGLVGASTFLLGACDDTSRPFGGTNVGASTPVNSNSYTATAGVNGKRVELTRADFRQAKKTLTAVATILAEGRESFNGGQSVPFAQGVINEAVTQGHPGLDESMVILLVVDAYAKAAARLSPGQFSAALQDAGANDREIANINQILGPRGSTFNSYVRNLFASGAFSSERLDNSADAIVKGNWVSNMNPAAARNVVGFADVIKGIDSAAPELGLLDSIAPYINKVEGVARSKWLIGEVRIAFDPYLFSKYATPSGNLPADSFIRILQTPEGERYNLEKI